MWTDPIVEELHRVREAHAARFHNVANKIPFQRRGCIFSGIREFFQRLFTNSF